MADLETGRRPLIAGNWKMQKTSDETRQYLDRLKTLLDDSSKIDVAVAPPYLSLETAVKTAAGSAIRIAAQNVFWEQSGAFTGEISVPMLKAIGVDLVIIGHSERRQYFKETDASVNKRLKAALSSGMTVIFCVGETLDQRESNQTFDVLGKQVAQGLAGLDFGPGQLIMAYEPVWAIGTGKTATSKIAQEAHEFIRSLLADNVTKELASLTRILYGGSVKPENAAELMAQPDIDGALVGGASLDPDVFYKIIAYKGE